VIFNKKELATEAWTSKFMSGQCFMMKIASCYLGFFRFGRFQRGACIKFFDYLSAKLDVDTKNLKKITLATLPASFQGVISRCQTWRVSILGKKQGVNRILDE
jgi:hypothetical protein